MAELLKSVEKPSINPPGVLDLVGMLVAKRVIDAVAMPVVGNNNVVSGLAKLIGGGLGHNKLGRLGNIATGGLILDGADDIAGVAMGYFDGKMGGRQSRQQVNPGAPR